MYRESRSSLDCSDWFLIGQSGSQMGTIRHEHFCCSSQEAAKRCFSFLPDPQAEGIDALVHPWSNLRPCASPPFILLGRILHKIEQARVGERTLIAPIWANQSWFPLLLGCLVNFPIILPETPALLRNPVGNLKPSKTSRLKSVWDQAKDRGLLEETFIVICSSWRSGTERSHLSAWSTWIQWCSERI